MIKDAVANHIPRDETVDGECIAPTGMNRGKRIEHGRLRLFQPGIVSASARTPGPVCF
jgi:hypothetical protein